MEKAERKTGETPFALLNRPLPTQWNRIYWDAFHDLTGSRSWSMAGPAEIHYVDKIAWLDENRITDEDDRAEVITTIQKLDEHYLNHVYEKK